MCKKLLFLILAAGFCLISSAHAATIIWVSDNKTPAAGVAADQGWVDLLSGQGYTVDLSFRSQQGRTLDATKIAALNAADLIIVSRDTSSGDYDDGTEPSQWNSITTPILMQVPHIARSAHWKWLNTTATNDSLPPAMVAVEPGHYVFKGVALDASNQVSVFTEAGSFASTTAAGNGKLIARRADNDQVWIVEWQAGQEFYAGSGQTAAGPRMLFSSGTNSGVDGRYNLTAEGQKIFLNAVRYMLGERDDPGKAVEPNPADGQTDVPRDVTLRWTPGKYAPTVNGHIVYLSENFNAVNDGIGGVRQSASSFAPPQRLNLETTYYWRVDEVNAPPSSAVHQGDVWSFTTEPVAYSIAVGSVTATASSSDTSKGPENTVNGSGLDATGMLHGDVGNTMWLSDRTAVQPTWIEFAFDKVYRLHEMWVWNSNESLEPAIGLGLKDVTIEYSADGTAYVALGTTHEFAQGPGAPGYAHNTTVDLSGVTAKYIRLTANSNWGGFLSQYGLSEVRFFYIPVNAREPNPESGATDVDVDGILGWRAGREAARHDVYVGADPNALTLAGTATESAFDTASLGLALEQSYYWRVDEVNEAEIPAMWQGDLWTFSTPEFLVVDDFESYNDVPDGEPGSNLVYVTWLDGYANPTTNGSTIGYAVPFEPTMETGQVHGGEQSVPLTYDNSVASVSEVTVNPGALAIGGDWTTGVPQTLVLWFHGSSANAVTERMYVKVNGVKVVYPGAAANIARARWNQWNIDLAALNTNLGNVTQLSIGFERTGATGGTGTVLIDDIRLYKSAPEIVVPSEEIWIEAEATASITAPMKVYDSPAASAGRYIGTDESDGDSTGNPPATGIATYTFTVAGGTYKVSGRINIPNANNSFWVRIQGATTPAETELHSSGWVRWNDPPAVTNWFWNDVFSDDDDQDATVLFTMPAGTYTLEIARREAGAMLDALVISKVD